MAAATLDPRLTQAMAQEGKMEYTCTVQIGNSDDKLNQREWITFMRDVHLYLRHLLKGVVGQLHFFGTAPPDSEYQNACWVFVVGSLHTVEEMKPALAHIAMNNKQDSIALTLGATELVQASKQGNGEPHNTKRV